MILDTDLYWINTVQILFKLRQSNTVLIKTKFPKSKWQLRIFKGKLRIALQTLLSENLNV